jgi:hypothetical protein
MLHEGPEGLDVKLEEGASVHLDMVPFNPLKPSINYMYQLL